MDVITKYVEELSDGRLEVWGMPVKKNMLVSMVMLRGTESNPPTGGSDSGFTMSFEFNGLSRSCVLCGEDFIRYRPFKDSPEEILVDEEFDWGALWGNVVIGLGVVTAVVGGVVYCASIAFTGGASAVFAPYVMGGLTAVGGSWLVVSQAEKDYARGEVSGTMAYINSGLAGSASGALAGYAFCMAPYAAPTLLYGTGAGYVGSMAGLSDEMMIDFSETMLYALSFSNILVKGSDMVESTTGKNALKDVLGEDAYRIVGQVSEAGAAVTVIAGLSNPAYYVKNNQVAHFEQVPRVGEGGSDALETVSKTNPFALQPTHSQTLSKNKMNALMDDIKINGIQEPVKYVEYNEQMYVVDGHHRLLAAKKLGLTEISVEKVDLPYAGYNTIDDLLWFE